MTRIINVQKKFINHLLKNGKKEVSERILLNSFKLSQKKSIKESKKIFQVALINSIPLFKLHKIRNKKLKKKSKIIREIPAFVANKQSRVSLAVRFILRNIKKKENFRFYQKLKLNLVSNARMKNLSIETKNELQKSVLIKKHYFLYYKWK